MKVTTSPNFTVQNTQPNGNSSAPPPQQPGGEPPKDSFLQSVGKEAARSAVGTKNAFGLVGGKVGGAIGILPGLYAGMLGGAALGVFIGGGLGPMVAAVASEGGAFNFIGTSLGTVGKAAKLMMFAGGLTGAVGGWCAGEALVGTTAKIPGLAIGAASGAGKGAWNYITGTQGAANSNGGPSGPKDPDAPNTDVDYANMSAPIKVAGGLASAVGGISGAAGGAVIGAGVMSAGSLFNGLLVKDFAWQNLGNAAKTGAIGGALILGAAGIYGGWKLVEFGNAFVQKRIHNYHQAQQWMHLDKKENMLKEKEEQLNTFQTSILKSHEAAQANQKRRTKELDERQGVVGDKTAEAQMKEANQESLSAELANTKYKTEKGRLNVEEAKLNREKLDLDAEKNRLDEKEQKIPVLVEERATKMYNNRKAELQSIYTGRKDKVDAKEREVNNLEMQIPTTVNNKVQAALQPLRDNIRNTQASAERLDNQATQLRNEARNIEVQIPAVQDQARAAEREEGRLNDQANQRQPVLNQLQGEVDTSRRELVGKHTTNAELQSKLDQCENNKKK